MQPISLNQEMKTKMTTPPLGNSISRSPLRRGFVSFRRIQPWRNIHMRTFSLSVTKWLVVIAVTALLAPALFHSVAYGTDDNWLTTTGNWNIGTNWSTASPPTSSQNAVITNSGAAVSENINATIQNLTLGSGDSLGINNNIVLTI